MIYLLAFYSFSCPSIILRYDEVLKLWVGEQLYPVTLGRVMSWGRNVVPSDPNKVWVWTSMICKIKLSGVVEFAC